MEGRCHVANIGIGTTGITSAGGWVATTPDVHFRVPNGITVLPIRISVTFDALTDDTDLEILALTADELDKTPTGGTAVNSYNLRTDNPHPTGVTIQSDVTAITDPDVAGTVSEFWRVGAQIGAAPVAAQNEEGQPLTFEWFASKVVAPIIVGEGTLNLWCGIGATNYFAQIVWVELPSSTIV
jgi:hypothetical protein